MGTLEVKSEKWDGGRDIRAGRWSEAPRRPAAHDRGRVSEDADPDPALAVTNDGLVEQPMLDARIPRSTSSARLTALGESLTRPAPPRAATGRWTSSAPSQQGRSGNGAPPLAAIPFQRAAERDRDCVGELAERPFGRLVLAERGREPERSRRHSRSPRPGLRVPARLGAERHLDPVPRDGDPVTTAARPVKLTSTLIAPPRAPGSPVGGPWAVLRRRRHPFEGGPRPGRPGDEARPPRARRDPDHRAVRSMARARLPRRGQDPTSAISRPPLPGIVASGSGRSASARLLGSCSALPSLQRQLSEVRTGRTRAAAPRPARVGRGRQEPRWTRKSAMGPEIGAPVRWFGRRPEPPTKESRGGGGTDNHHHEHLHRAARDAGPGPAG